MTDDASMGRGGHDNSAQGVASELLLNLRHKDFLPRFVANMTWAVGLPCFSFWTVLGTKWLYQVIRETPECMPTSTHLYFSLFWIFLCYAWIVVHAALGVAAVMLERMVRRAEGRLQGVEDADMRRRWGEVGHIGSYQELMGVSPASGQGLTSEEIQALPSTIALAGEGR